MENGANHTGLVLTRKGPAAGNHLVEHCAERKDVGAGVGLFSFQLLRGHVLVGAEDGSLLRKRFRHSRQGRSACSGGIGSA